MGRGRGRGNQTSGRGRSRGRGFRADGDKQRDPVLNREELAAIRSILEERDAADEHEKERAQTKKLEKIMDRTLNKFASANGLVIVSDYACSTFCLQTMHVPNSVRHNEGGSV